VIVGGDIMCGCDPFTDCGVDMCRRCHHSQTCPLHVRGVDEGACPAPIPPPGPTGVAPPRRTQVEHDIYAMAEANTRLGLALADAMEEVGQLRAALLAVEWSAGSMQERCAGCGSTKREGHHSWCTVAAALRTWTPRQEPTR
jgi:hypothetical protein